MNVQINRDQLPFTLTIISEIEQGRSILSRKAGCYCLARNRTFDQDLHHIKVYFHLIQGNITVDFYRNETDQIDIGWWNNINQKAQFILNVDGKSFGYKSNTFEIVDAPNLHQFWRQCGLNLMMTQYAPDIGEYIPSGDVIRLICSYLN